MFTASGASARAGLASLLLDPHLDGFSRAAHEASHGLTADSSSELGGAATVRPGGSVFMRAPAEGAASCEVYGLLKRPDEKYVTERAYDNPKFVEDLVRDVALALEADDRVLAYTVESENFESIHNHSAYALIERDKRTDDPGSA